VIFLVEYYEPASDPSATARIAGRARTAVSELVREGAELQFLRATLVPAEQTCFLLYKAASAELVSHATQRAAIRGPNHRGAGELMTSRKPFRDRLAPRRASTTGADVDPARPSHQRINPYLTHGRHTVQSLAHIDHPHAHKCDLPRSLDMRVANTAAAIEAPQAALGGTVDATRLSPR
jgi:hypothetical protein